MPLQELLENPTGIEWLNLKRNVRMIVGDKQEREKTDDRKEQKTEKSKLFSKTLFEIITLFDVYIFNSSISNNILIWRFLFLYS